MNMRTNLFETLLGAFLLLPTSFALAAEPSATFEDLSTSDLVGTSISSGDFSFFTGYPVAYSLHGISNAVDIGSHNGTNYLVYLGSGERTETFSLTSGGAFDLTHIDLGGSVNAATAFSITITGYKAGSAGGTVSTTLNLLGSSFKTFTVENGLAGFTALQSVKLSGVSNVSYVALDNINYVPAITPVPEPETYAFMLGGLALVGWAARRRRTVV